MTYQRNNVHKNDSLSSNLILVFVLLIPSLLLGTRRQNFLSQNRSVIWESRGTDMQILDFHEIFLDFPYKNCKKIEFNFDAGAFVWARELLWQPVRGNSGWSFHIKSKNEPVLCALGIEKARFLSVLNLFELFDNLQFKYTILKAPSRVLFPSLNRNINDSYYLGRTCSVDCLLLVASSKQQAKECNRNYQI